MKFEYIKVDEEKMQELINLQGLNKLFEMLLVRLGGDPDKAMQVMKDLQKKGYIGSNVDLNDFEKKLQKEGNLKVENGKKTLTKRGSKALSSSMFNNIFSKLKRGRAGSHLLDRSGFHYDAVELSSERRKYEFGDDFSQVDSCASFFNQMARSGSLDSEIEERDFEVYESQVGTDMAIVLMIDISHSMVLYGEDRITPAKELALALSHMISIQQTKDDLSVVLFGDDAVQVPKSELASIAVGPFHTNTQMGIRKAREILVKKKQRNKQIIMITDGKPSMIKLSDGNYYKNSFGLDPEIVSRTLDEAILCRKRQIPITTFMITQDRILMDFVKNLTQANRGKAFYCDSSNLGSFVIESFMKGKRGKSRRQ